MNKNAFEVRFITISMNESGQRIDNFLHNYFKNIPKSMIYRILRKGEIRVNKKRTKPRYKLQNNDKLRIPPIRDSSYNLAPIPIKLDKVIALNNSVLYEDASLLILNKPAGTAVHGGSGINFGVIEILRALRSEERFLELVHRLDRDTSGVLLIAKQRSTLCALHEQLRARGIQKDYLALVRGQWKPHIKVISAPLIKSILSSGKRIVKINKKGKLSETHFKIEEKFSSATLVRASPVTGRTHQIRVHACYAGNPIAFDNRYGDIKFDRQLKICNLNRMFLHAVAIRFEHPISGENFLIEAPLDFSLNQCLIYLRNHYKL